VIRDDLRERFGQNGKRDRNKVRQRKDLASELQLSDHTLKGFINGKQKSLGENARVVLLKKMPALALLYRQALGGLSGGTTVDSGGESRANQGSYIQLTLQFDGLDDQPTPVIAHLPPGKEGVLTLRIATARLA
jgi:hypothetical protein